MLLMLSRNGLAIRNWPLLDRASLRYLGISRCLTGTPPPPPGTRESHAASLLISAPFSTLNATQTPYDCLFCKNGLIPAVARGLPFRSQPQPGPYIFSLSPSTRLPSLTDFAFSTAPTRQLHNVTHRVPSFFPPLGVPGTPFFTGNLKGCRPCLATALTATPFAVEHAAGRAHFGSLPRVALQKLLRDTWKTGKALASGSIQTLIRLTQNPALLMEYYSKLIEGIMHGIDWTRRGLKMFGANFKVSLLLAKKKLKGQPLSYREHKLLVRTTSDCFKLIPFSFFLAVPFAELLLPVALWLFPGMLPSTFSDKQFDNSYLQRKLKAKQELVQFFQELVVERTRQVLEESTCDRSKDRARLLKEFQEKLILKAKREALDQSDAQGSRGNAAGETGGEGALNAVEADDINPFLSLKETLTYAKLFREEFKLENMPTRALLVLCDMLGLRPYRIRANIILQLRYHILRLQEEDRQILWEGVDSLTTEELRDACRERAMRFYGVSDEIMREQMTQWLALSSHKDIPPLLLLWSRSITLTHAATEKRPTALPSAVSADELLPVIEPDKEVRADKKDEARQIKQEQLKVEFQRIDQYVEELKDTAQQLENEQRKEKEKLSAVYQQTPDQESLVEDNKNGGNSQKPSLARSQETQTRSRQSKEVLLRKIEKLEKEIDLIRNVSNLQHEQVSLVIRTLVTLIDDYRGDEAGVTTSAKRVSRPTKALEDFVNRLETAVSTFEQGVGRISDVLEKSKALHMASEDAAFYPSSPEEEEAGPFEPEATSMKPATSRPPSADAPEQLTQVISASSQVPNSARPSGESVN